MVAAVLALPGIRTATAATANMTIVSNSDVQVIQGNTGLSTPYAAVAALEPGIADPNPPDPNDSLWDGQLSHAFTGGADWIWESNRAVHSLEGDIVYFQRTFSISGYPTAGTLYITCDNGYEAWLNGILVGSAQLGVGWETSNRTQFFVDTGNWQSVEAWDVSGFLTTGTNVLMVKAVNEYMGPLDNQLDGRVNYNPAGLIFQLDIAYDTGLGCVCSWGYWKTHSSYGPASYDDTWALVGENTPFFLSNTSYYRVLQTDVSGGNAYYQLAHQYIAAKLNKLNGAWMPGDVQAAYDQATHLFEVYTPIVVAMYKKGIPSQRAIVNQFSQLASILDAYNNGLMGTPHCS
jgi:hypothetical protein